MKEKFCNNCKTEKPVEEFSKAKNRHDGYQVYCKTCHNVKYNKIHNKKNRKRLRVKIDGKVTGYLKPKYDREVLLQQISKLREKESNPQTRSGNDYSFLWTNEKFWK